MRLENSVRNIRAAWIFQLIHILCQFITRTVIIKVLTIEYVGLSGLFSNVLTMLSLAELGIGEAIIFSLYSPIAKKDEKTIKAIMVFYKKIYICVGVLILVVGVAITPYINFFIKDIPDIKDISLIYVLYVFNSGVSYFFSYKSAFVTATQSNYLVVLNNGIWEILMVISQIVSLYFTKDYVIYMCIGVAFVVIRNISITILANHKFSYLREKSKDKIPTDIVNQIKKNTGAMILHKIGTVIVFATSNIILSKFVGLISVGIYTNYYTITNSVSLFINKFFDAISASVGNLAVEENTETQEKVFYRVLFVNFGLYTFACTCLMSLLNPFLLFLWLGPEYLFSQEIVALLVIQTYITGMRRATQTFKNAKGLYWYNRYMPIYESILNLVASIVLVNIIGVAGVILATIISSVCTCVWIEPHVLYKYGFQKSAKQFYIRYLKYGFVFLCIVGVTFAITSAMGGTGILIFIVKMIISCMIPLLSILIIYRKNDELNYVIDILKRKFILR